MVALVLQSIAGHASFSEQQVEHQSPELSYLRYITSSAFGVAVTARGSPESEPVSAPHHETSTDV